MAKGARKFSTKRMEQKRGFFTEFLDETYFPDTGGIGKRGPKIQHKEFQLSLFYFL